MVTIISTAAARRSVETEMRRALPVAHWLCVNALPYREGRLISLLKRAKIERGAVILLVRYGRRTPSDFPPICVGPYIFSQVFYSQLTDLRFWSEALMKYDHGPPTNALALAMMKPLYLKWGEAIFRCLGKKRYLNGKVSRNFADTTTHLQLGRKLSKGCSLAVYVGHGRSRGWSGYRGFRWKHLAGFRQKAPIGTLISLSCSSLFHDKKNSLPLGVQLVMAGRGCAFLGTWDAVQIVPLRHITRILIELFEDLPVMPLGEFLAVAHRRIVGLNDPEVNANWSNFRLVGSPLIMI